VSKKAILTHAMVLIVGLVIGIALMYPIATNVKWFVNISETFKEKPSRGFVDVIVYRSDGTIERYGTPNIVVTIGKQRVRDLLLGNAADPTNVTSAISLSNDATPLATWEKLPNEIVGSGLTRAAGTVTIINSTAYQSQHTFTATATVSVQCSGLHWSTVANSTGNLFAAATFTSTTLNANDQIQITWTVNLQ